MMSEYKKHPSYGMAGFYRVQGTRDKLFGSSIEHATTIRLDIKEGVVKHDLGRDWYHGGSTLIEIELSPAQFVEMLTTMNCGDGVPCTIRYRPGDGYIEDPPDEGTEPERVRDYFRKCMEETADRLKEMMKNIEELSDAPRLKKADQKALLHEAEMLVQEVEKNMPFYYDQYSRAVDKRDAQSKADIEAAVALTLQRLGLSKLSELRGLSEQRDDAKLLASDNDND